MLNIGKGIAYVKNYAYLCQRNQETILLTTKTDKVMKEVKIVKKLFEECDILVMGWKQSNGRHCEWICELAIEIFEDEILDYEVEVVFGVYTDYSEDALLNEKTTFEGGFCDAQEYFREPTTEELVKFYKAKANYYQEKAKKIA